MGKRIDGTNKRDELLGTAGADDIYGYGGNDLIGGHDGNDRIYGGSGNDVLNGMNGDDSVYGGTGHDEVYGGNGHDTLFGDSGNDYLAGNAGNDRLHGGSGNDVVRGGAGTDVALFSGTIDDVVSISATHYDNRPAYEIVGRDGRDILVDIERVTFAQGGTYSLIQLIDIVSNRPTEGSDNLVGTSGSDEIRGLGGNDTISGLAGNDRLFGNNGNDTLLGGFGDDTLIGGAGADTLSGDEGNDYLQGDAGNDVLRGRSGNDRLHGGAGNDLIYGGAGTDTALLAGTIDDVVSITATTHDGAPAHRIVSTSGSDVLISIEKVGFAGGGTYDLAALIQIIDSRPTSGNDDITGTAGADEIHAMAGDDIVRGEGGADRLYGEAGNDKLYGGDGNDRLYGGDHFDRLEGGAGDDHLDGGNSADTIYGGSGNDLVLGGHGHDKLYGGVGNDRLEGGEHDDKLYGGAGADVLYGGTENDTLDGGDGNDRLYGQAGNDTLTGGSGNDHLYGNNGNDHADGGSGDDRLYGNFGDDTLLGSAGDDRLFGAEGADTLRGGSGNDLVDGGAGDDIVHGGAGVDTALLAGTVDDVVSVTATTYGGAPAHRVVSGSGSDLLIDIEKISFADGGTLDLAALIQVIENRPTTGNDDIVGTSAADEIHALAGDDIVRGDGGADRLYGDAGDDKLYGGDGDDRLYGGDHWDRLEGGAGNDHLDGGTNADTIYGGSGDDVALGGHGHDKLYGGVGDDRLEGGDHNDQLFGGAGSDVLYGGNENDILDGGDQNDRLYGDAGDDNLIGGAGDDTLKGGAGNDVIDGGIGDDTLNGGAGADTVSGGDGDDHVLGDADNDVLRGQSGNDRLHGGVGDDLIYGGAGVDTALFAGTIDDVVSIEATTHSGVPAHRIVSTSGTDILIDVERVGFAGGGTYELAELIQLINNRPTSGNDDITGTWDADEIHALAGDDTVRGEEGADRLYGDAGNDKLYGGDGDDRLEGGEHDDRLYGGAGADALYGGTENDILDGGDGKDRLYGQAGDDSLIGGAGNDELYGNNGDDTVDGGTGDDRLYGNAGNDILLGSAGADRLYGGDGNDTLRGGSGNDHLDGGAGVNVLHGGAGEDVVVLAGSRANYGDRALIEKDGNGETMATLSLKSGGGEQVLYAIEKIAFAADPDRFYVLDEAGFLKETWQGTNGPDTYVGTNGADHLNGLGGNDLIFGEAGADTILGGTGNDTLVGDADLDFIYGEDGDDSLFAYTDILSDYAQDQLYGGFGNDYLQGSLGRNWLFGDDGDDRLFGEAGDDVLFGDTGYFGVGTGDDEIVGDDGNDRIFGEAGNDRLWGMAHSDSIWGGLGRDEIYGGDGNDFLFGGGQYEDFDGQLVDTDDGSDDMLDGEAGNDEVTGSFGNNQMWGGTGNDYLWGLSGNDLLIGDTGVNTQAGGNDVLHGDEGDDTLWGEGGTDLLFGGDGADQVNGGHGNDELYAGAEGDLTDTAADQLFGDEGDDTLHGDAGEDDLFGGTGNDDLRGNGGLDYLYGEDGNDSLQGNDGNDVLFGGMGDDVLYGNDGDDDLVGDTFVEGAAGGRDELHGGDGNDFLDGEAGDDRLWGDDGQDVLHGRQGEDELHGGAGDDDLFGWMDDDLLNGNDGEDLLFGGGGDDVLNGGNGNDGLLGDTGNDTIDGGAGTDAFIARGLKGHYDLVKSGSVYTITDTRAISNSDGTDTLTNVERIIFADDEEMTLDEYIQWLDDNDGGPGDNNVPTEGDDLLDGDDQANDIDGLGGDDRIRGFGGDDTLRGGAGDDILEGGAGNDLLDGGSGTDVAVVTGLKADYTLVAEGSGYRLTDKRTQSGNDGSDLLVGIERIRFGDGDELTIDEYIAWLEDNGGGPDDNNVPTEGDDILTGDDTDNTIDGLGGDDQISGLGGNDVLIGGAGNDVLDGGAGTDTVVVTGLRTDYEIAVEGNGYRLTDLRTGQDGSDLIIDIEVIRFGDGEEMTPEEYRLWLDARAGATEGNDELHGDEGDNVIRGLGGNDKIFGHGGSDQLYGDAGADELDGGAGNDFLYGGDGQDLLHGDTPLSGGTGNDYLDGGAGNDQANGYGGNDTFRASKGADTLYGASGRDRIVVSGGREDYDLEFRGSGTFDTYFLTDLRGLRAEGEGTEWMNGVDEIEFGNGQVMDLDDYLEWLQTQGGGTEGPDTLIGTEGNDTIHGLGGADKIDGLAGDDRLFGGDGPDQIWGRAGNDHLEGGRNADTMFGGDGRDVLLGQHGIDTLRGGAGDDELDGGDGDDRLFGDSGDDHLTGGAGENRLDGGSGNDRAHYAQNRYTAISATTTGIFTIETSDGFDTLIDVEIATFLNGPTISFYPNTRPVDDLPQDYQSILSDVYVQINGTGASETLTGTELGDIVLTAGGRNIVDTGGGNDGVLGGGDIDLIMGGAGNDVLLGVGGDDTIEGGAGGDEIHGGGGHDTIDGGADGDVLFGNVGNDSIAGGGGNDLIFGGLGADDMAGGTGNDEFRAVGTGDKVSGGSGNDVVELADATFTEIDGGAGNGDAIVLSDAFQTAGAGHLDLSGNRGEVRNIETIDLSAAATGRLSLDSATIQALSPDSGRLVVFGNPENQVSMLGTWDDRGTIQIGARHFLLFDAGGVEVAIQDDIRLSDGSGEPTEGDDLLIGEDGVDDEISGLGGNDIIRGLGGNDTLSGDDGNDELYGGSGDDVLFGGRGDDFIDGGEGIDFATIDAPTYSDFRMELNANLEPEFVITSTDGEDRFLNVERVSFVDGPLIDLYTDPVSFGEWAPEFESRLNFVTAFVEGTDNADTLRGSNWDTVIDGGRGSDTIIGGDREDGFWGGAGNDDISGGGGDDLIYGGADRDTLTGDDGSDAIFGEAGIDFIDGGDGNDWLDGGSNDDVIETGAGNDLVFGADGDDEISAGLGQNVIVGGAGRDIVTLSGTAASHDIGGGTHSGAGPLTWRGALDLDPVPYLQAGGDFLTVATRSAEPMAPPSTDNMLVGVERIEFDQTPDFFIDVDYAGENTISRVTFNGSSERDTLDDTPFDDVIRGRGGEDLIDIDSGGADRAFGDSGNDIFFVESDDFVILNGGEGHDSVHFDTAYDAPDGLPPTFLPVFIDLTEDSRRYESIETFNLTQLSDATLTVDAFAIVDIAPENEILFVEGGTDHKVDLEGSWEEEDPIFGDFGASYRVFVSGNESIAIDEDIEILINGEHCVVDLSSTGPKAVGGPGDGTNGDDVLTGTDQGETIEGLCGDDVLYGLGGDDILVGGGGADELYGGGQDDILIGEGGSDLLDGGAANDTIFGGTGDDRMVFGRGDDTLDGSAGTDTATVGGAPRYDIRIDRGASVPAAAAGPLVTVTGSDGSSAEIINTEFLVVDGEMTVEIFETPQTMSGGVFQEPEFRNVAFDTRITATGANASIGLSGTSGNDFIEAAPPGSSVRRVDLSDSGKDVIVGGAGTTTVVTDRKISAYDIDVRNVPGGDDIILVDRKGSSAIAGMQAVDQIEFSNVVVDVNENGSEALTFRLLGNSSGSPDIVDGSSAAELYIFGRGDYVIDGNGGADKFRWTGTTGEKFVDGGGGVDNFWAQEDFSEYHVARYGSSSILVAHDDGGTSILSSMEELDFGHDLGVSVRESTHRDYDVEINFARNQSRDLTGTGLDDIIVANGTDRFDLDDFQGNDWFQGDGGSFADSRGGVENFLISVETRAGGQTGLHLQDARHPSDSVFLTGTEELSFKFASVFYRPHGAPDRPEIRLDYHVADNLSYALQGDQNTSNRFVHLNGDGNEYLGGSANDIFTVSNNRRSATFRSGGGDDTVELPGSIGIYDVRSAGSEVELFVLTSGATIVLDDIETAYFTDLDQYFRIDPGHPDGFIPIDGSRTTDETNDTFVEQTGNDYIVFEHRTGTDGDDRLSGGAGNDSFAAGGGSDRISGGDGIDVLYFEGAAEDYFVAGSDWAEDGQYLVLTYDGMDQIDGIEALVFAGSNEIVLLDSAGGLVGDGDFNRADLVAQSLSADDFALFEGGEFGPAALPEHSGSSGSLALQDLLDLGDPAGAAEAPAKAPGVDYLVLRGPSIEELLAQNQAVPEAV